MVRCRFGDLHLVVIDEKVHPQDWPQLAGLEFEFPDEVRSAVVRASSARCAPPYLFIELFVAPEPIPGIPSIGTMVVYGTAATPSYDLYAVSTRPFRHLVQMARCPVRPEPGGPSADLVGRPAVQAPDGTIAFGGESELVVEHADADNLWIRHTLHGWLGVSPTPAIEEPSGTADPAPRLTPAKNVEESPRRGSPSSAKDARPSTSPPPRSELVRRNRDRAKSLLRTHPDQFTWRASPEEMAEVLIQGAESEDFDNADPAWPAHVEEVLRAGRRVLMGSAGTHRIQVVSAPWRGSVRRPEPKSDDVVAWERAKSEQRWRLLPAVLVVGALITAAALLVRCPAAEDPGRPTASVDRRPLPPSPARAPPPTPRTTPSPRPTPVPVLERATTGPSPAADSVVLMGIPGQQIPVYDSMAPRLGAGAEVGEQVARGAVGVHGRKLSEVREGGVLLGILVEFADGTRGHVRASGVGYPYRVVRVRADDTLNVRTGRSHKRPKITEIPPGGPVYVLSTHARSTAECARQSGPSKWWRVQTLEGKEGYVNCHFLGPF